MWSHYVQSHSGICIKFSSSIVYPFPTYSDDTSLERIISESYNIYNRFYKVRYVKSPPRVRFEDSYDWFMKALMYLFLTRYDIWRYGEEVRSVRLLEPTSNINGIKQNFYDSDIEAIYIGAVAQQSTIDAIKEILIKYYSVDIPIYKARLNPNKFGLTFSKVSF
jgi:hypothetical protein